jgi:hypothetical protein
MDITKKTPMIPKQPWMTPKETSMDTSMFTYEQCIKKLLTTQGLNAPIIQHI